MSYKNMNYIVEIAKHRNISKAAEKLFISQSALSISLKKTEQELGAELFTRKNNMLIPTPEGELFVDTAKEILRLEQELYAKIKSSENDVFTIGISSETAMTIFTKVLSDFKKIHPHFRSSIIDSRSEPLIARLKEGMLKCILVPSIYQVPLAKYCCEMLKDEEMVFVLPKSHPLAGYASDDFVSPPRVDASVFANESYILAPPDTIESVLFQQIFSDYHISPTILFEINRTRYICQLIKDEHAITIQPESCVPRDMDLVICKPLKEYHRYMHLIHRKNMKFNTEEKELIKAVKYAYASSIR